MCYRQHKKQCATVRIRVDSAAYFIVRMMLKIPACLIEASVHSSHATLLMSSLALKCRIKMKHGTIIQ